jgi:probable F420-dependent oxidoreductase
MPRLAASFPFERGPLRAQAARLPELCARGYTDVWTQETARFDAFGSALVAALAAPGARVGTSVAGVFARGPGLLALQAAALADLAPGRCVVGVGASSPAIVEGWNAARFERPVARVRDTLAFLRRALAGERVDADFETFRVHGFRLEQPPAEPPPLYAAALRPGMLRLAAREADGVCLSLLGADDVPRVLAEAHAAGEVRDAVLGIAVCPTPDAERVRAAGRRFLAQYLSLPTYARFHAWLGREAVLAPVQAAMRAGDRAAAAAAVPDALVDALLVHGPPEACREQLARFAAAGVTTLVLSIWPFGTDPFEALCALAPG